MRRILLALVFLFVAVPAAAQVNVTVTFSARQNTTLTREMTDANLATCKSLFVAEDPRSSSCTQAQARNQYCSRTEGTSHPCGTGATASSNIRIFSSLTEMLQKLNDDIEATARARQKAADAAAFCVRWAGLSQAQKDARCTADGQTAGCDLCP